MRSSARTIGGIKASPEQWKELVEARTAFDEVRPHGWQDAEAAYAKDESLAREAGSGKVNRAIRVLQLETEIGTDPQHRADRFVERWQKLDRASLAQYEAGDISGYNATRSAMGDMAKSLERDPQLESILANRKAALGIEFESGRSLGRDLAISHGLGRGPGARIVELFRLLLFLTTERRARQDWNRKVQGRPSLLPCMGPDLSRAVKAAAASRWRVPRQP